MVEVYVVLITFTKTWDIENELGIAVITKPKSHICCFIGNILRNRSHDFNLKRILSTTKPCHLVVASYNVAGREKLQRKIYFSSRFYEAMNLYTDGLHTSNGHGNLCPHRSTRRGSC